LLVVIVVLTVGGVVVIVVLTVAGVVVIVALFFVLMRTFSLTQGKGNLWHLQPLI
jgi:hypothetical protein